MRAIIIPLMLFIALPFTRAFAQHHNELYLSAGVVTPDEISGWEGRGGIMKGYISSPTLTTHALFFTYRRTFSKRFSLGITAGIDNETGELSYGNPEETGQVEGTSGYYNVYTYTIAIEGSVTYFKRRYLKLYGCAGIGITSYDDIYTIYPNPPSWVPVPPKSPYDYHEQHFNAQITGFGIRMGRTIAGFFEVGFGYKGLISTGISAKF